MAQYDGSIRIGTDISTKEAKKELKNLEGSITKTANEIASLRSKMDALKDVKTPTKEFIELDDYIKKTTSEVDKLSAKLMSMKKSGLGGTEEYSKLKEQYSGMKNAVQEAKSELQNLIDAGKAFTFGSDTKKYAEMQEKMRQLNQKMQSDTERQTELQSQLAAEEQRIAEIKSNATVSDKEILDLLERRKQLVAEIADMERAGVGLGYKEYDSANQQLAEINNKIKAYKDKISNIPEQFSKIRNSAKKAFSAITSGYKQSNASLSGGLKTILKYGFGIRSLYVLFNKVRSGITKGFTNLMGYSGDFANSIQSVKNSMSTLGNQIAGAFAPIVQMVIPWLNSLISALSTAMTYVAQFIVALGGSSTFTKAKKVQDSYNKSLGGTAKAADKARGALAKFDDLDVLQKQGEASDAGGVGALGADMFEEAPVDKKIIDFWGKIKEASKAALDALRKLWNEGLSLFTNFVWDTLRDFYHHFLVPVGKWVLGEGLPRFFEITNNLLKSIDWGYLQKRLRDFYDVLAEMAKFTFKALLDFYEDFLAPVAVWTMNKALPTLLKTLTDLGNKIKWDVLNDALRSMFKTLSKFAVGIGDGLIRFWQGIEPLLTSTLAGIINATAKALRLLFDVIGMIPEDVLVALGGALGGVFSVFIAYEAVTGIMGAISGAWTNLWQSLQAGISVLAANPYLAVAAGIGAMVGALTALDEKVAERSQIEEYGQTLDSLCASINNRSEAIKNQSDAVKNYVDNAGMGELMLAEDLAEKYYELSSQEGLTNAQKEEMRALSERLVELIPELSDSINKETGMLSAQKDEVYDLIEAKREQYRLEAAKESIIEAYQNQLEAEKNLKDATDLTSQAQEKYNEEVRKYNEAMEDYNKHAYDFVEAPTYKYVAEARDNWSELSAELEIAANAFDTAQESITYLERVMESGGKDCTDGFIEGYDAEKMTQTVRDSAQDCIDAFRETNDSHSPSKVYAGLAKDTIDGYVVGIEENKSSAISAIRQLCNEIMDAFVSAFYNEDACSGIFTGINEQVVLFMEMWRESFTLWQEENTELYFGYDIWYEQWENMLTAYNDVNSQFMSEWQSNMSTWWNTMVMPYFTVAQWTLFGTNMKTGIMTGFKTIVNEIGGVLNHIITLFNAAYKQLESAMNDLIDDYNAKAAIMGTSTLSHVSYSAMPSIKVPALATGAVIRGGNPFLAILGDQPAGKTNIEAPANLIKDMARQGIREELSSMNFGTGQAKIVLNLNGIDVGEAMLDDLFSVMDRRGYDVEILGYN